MERHGATRSERLKARRRAERTEFLRQQRWKEIDEMLGQGRISGREAARMRQMFWEDRTKDELVTRHLERDYFRGEFYPNEQDAR